MESIGRRRRAVFALAALLGLVVVTTAAGADGRPVKQIVAGPGLTGGGEPDKDGVISLGIDPDAISDSIAGDFIQNGTDPQDASFNVMGSAAIGSGLGSFTNKLRVAGGNWNPNDSDTDVLIGDAVYRLKIGVANGGAGAGDARIRAQGGTNRLMLGGGMNDTLAVTPERVGIGTLAPERQLDVSDTARIGAGANDFANKLWVKGGNWNPDAGDSDVLIGSANHRLEIGVATGGGGAGDVRLRAQGGTNRIMIGGGTSNHSLTITPTRVGVGTPSPNETLDVDGDAHVSGALTKSYAGGSANAAPIAYGVVRSDGTKASGTPNFTSTYDATTNIYWIDVVGHNINLATAVVVQPSGGTPVVPMMTFSGDLAVRLFDLSGANVQRTFSFVVYRR